MNKFMSLSLPVLSGVMLISGCATNTSEQHEVDNQIKQGYEDKLKARDNKITALESSIQTLSKSSNNNQTMPNTNLTGVNDDLLPPNAKAGQCFARTFTPPIYNTERIRVLKKESSERIEIVPAQYANTEEKVLTREQSERIEVVPAVYDWVEDRVLVSPETIKLQPVAASYKIEYEKVLDKPEHTVWKKGDGPITKIDEATGEILCLVTIPATYKTVSKRVLVKNAHTVETVVPAKYKTVKRRILVKEASVNKVTIPAEYKMVKSVKLVQPETTRTTPVSEEYEEVVKRFKVKDGVVEWRPVLCKTNITPELVRELQTKLKEKGFHPGPIDGVYGTMTASATNTYQKSNNLPRGGLTINTLKSLEILH